MCNRPRHLLIATTFCSVFALSACNRVEDASVSSTVEPAPTPQSQQTPSEAAKQQAPGEMRQSRKTAEEGIAVVAEPATGAMADAAEAPVAAASEPEVTALPVAPLASMSRPRSSITAGDSVAHLRPPSEPLDRENYASVEDNPVKRAAEEPVSTFSIDVDTGAYANVRRFLNQGRLPPEDAVRVEELINYFEYDYPLPVSRTPPFQVTTEFTTTPWNPDTRLLQIGIKGFEVPHSKLPPANLVFLVDVSGSMNSPDKLPLLKSALTMLSKQMRPQDRVSLAVYAGAAGVVLEPTPGNDTAAIRSALEQLQAGGSTNGGQGIRLAYALAEQAFISEGINRVLIATDGDFNVGTVDFEALKDLVERKRETGVALTTLGFGTGNYNDHLMEQLADAGNGNYSYIDTLNEARKVLVDELSSTLAIIAKDVKIQLEFNPAVVAEYRLIGYENRMLRREDFNNDAVDAGEIGAGHTVTALYEIALVGSDGILTEALRYSGETTPQTPHGDELGFLRLRYKAPDGEVSQLMETPIRRDQEVALKAASPRLRFAAAVAAFGQKLRGGRYTGEFNYDDIAGLAREARGEDSFGYRSEFLSLVALADALSD